MADNFYESREVFHWPEFRALVEKLGFRWEGPHRDITIHLPLEGLASITANTLAPKPEQTQNEE